MHVADVQRGKGEDTAPRPPALFPDQKRRAISLTSALWNFQHVSGPYHVRAAPVRVDYRPVRLIDFLVLRAVPIEFPCNIPQAVAAFDRVGTNTPGAKSTWSRDISAFSATMGQSFSGALYAPAVGVAGEVLAHLNHPL